MEKPLNLWKKMVKHKWKDEEEWRIIERKREKKESLHNKFCIKWISSVVLSPNEVRSLTNYLTLIYKVLVAK